MAETQTLILTQTIHCPPQEIYYAFTHAAAWEQWCCIEAQIDAQLGGRLYIYTTGYYAMGEFTNLEKGKNVAFNWNGKNEPPMQVQVNLITVDEGTHMTFTVTGSGSDQAWTDSIQIFKPAWERALQNLKSVLETGHSMFKQPPKGIPQTAAELAGQVGAFNDQLNLELNAILQGVSESRAGQVPAPGEWSAKQVIAHLITTERTALQWAARLTVGLDLHNWGTQTPCWVNAIASRYPTLPKLLVALRQSQAESIALIGGLPDEFLTHKGSFTRLARMFLQELPDHTRGHYEQIRGAVVRP